MADVDVLVVGAGPVGLTAACELRRRGVRCRIIDRLPAPQPFAKAVGMQPRTLEIWDRMGVAREALAAAAPLRGQLLYVNGAEQARIELHAERHPVGEEVVQRTVRHAGSGVQADPDDPSTVMRREAQLLVGYRGSPIVGPDRQPDQGPAAGDRAPDCGGLRHDLTTFPSRLFDLLRGQEHTLLLYADDEAQLAPYDEVVASARRGAQGQLSVWVIAAPHLRTDGLVLPVVHDSLDAFRQMYGARGGEGFLIRPDGYLGLRDAPVSGPGLVAHLALTFRG
ncbi:NAD(P)-binding protein [Streptomyces sp. ID38640]|uniref:FAD-dependent monooxygenase n=1 Tax=Streptomyces sp. ID38640 TaxID=1265399 RepID=UPI00140F48DF|nr:FAD-dependent monooxygenase [Streptomyces sp. ID38640]QIK05059.1 NAD(P)-binding protein [Streptomyces sp. ID38640]